MGQYNIFQVGTQTGSIRLIKAWLMFSTLTWSPLGIVLPAIPSLYFSYVISASVNITPCYGLQNSYGEARTPTVTIFREGTSKDIIKVT